MDLSLFFSLFFCYFIGFSYGATRFEITDSWNGGWKGNFYLDINSPVNGWKMSIQFDQALNEFEIFEANVIDNHDSVHFTVENLEWNNQPEPGTELSVSFIARFPENSDRKLMRILFNDQEVWNGDGQQPTPTTTQATLPPSPNPTPTGSTGPTTTKDPGMGYDYGEVIRLSNLFYEAQRSGKLPQDNRVPWRGDSFLQDGQDNAIDLTGGYFDAGDHVKFGFPLASFTTILNWGLIDYKDGYEAANEYENGLKTIKWSLDYFMKAHPAPTEFYGQVGDGHEDHSVWGRPEEWPQDKSRPSWKITASSGGSDLAGETSAAFASGYLIFKDSDPAYASECLRHARELYDFANEHRKVYTESITNARDFYNSWSGFGDELGWSAAWLYRATSEDKYLQDFKNHWQEFGLGGRPQEFSWDDKKAGLQVLMAKLTGEQIYIDAAQTFCDFIVNEVKRSPKGLCFISQWGALRHVSNVAFICLQAADVGINTASYREFAQGQIGYILGDTGRSFVVGYGQNSPQRPHHRSSSCPNLPESCDWEEFNNPGPNYQTLTGALVGGPDDQDQYEDRRDDYIKNEVATDYNAGFQSTLAGLNQLKAKSLI